MPEERPKIKTITLPSGTTYDIVDQGARDLIDGLSGSTSYLGVTTTELVDNVTTSPVITISGAAVTASAGGITTYGSKEFIYSGTVWQEFGDLSALGALANKDSATGNFTPSGNVTISKGTGTSNYTPTGSVSLTNSSVTPTITSSTGSSSSNTFQCGGTVGQPTVTVTPTTTTVNSITSVGTLPSFTATVQNENLTLDFSEGSLPTKGTDTTVATGISSATATAPTFTGSYVTLSNSSISVPSSASFSGEGVELKGTFSGTQGTVTVS